MSALNFPDAPSPGQLFAPGPPAMGIWLWDGSKWVNGGGPNNYLLLNGGHLSNPGNLIIDGTLQVAGATTLAAATTVTINVSGAATLGSTLAVTGAATLGNTLAVSGATTLGGTLAVTGATTLGSATGITLPTADSSVGLATTAFVKAQPFAPAVAGGYLPLSGGTLTGNLNGTNATFSGNVIGNNSVQSNGVYFVNSSGWFYTPQNFVAGGAVAVSGQTGFNWQYSGGWMYTPNPLQAAGRIYSQGDIAAAGVLRVGGDGSGYYWQQNGGWMYTPNQLLVGGNTNTHEIQMNNNNLDGCSNAYVGGAVYLPNSSATGGWGYVYGWSNGYWVGFNASDLLYAYNNMSLAGGVYWTYCDERLKWDIQPATRDCLAAINAIELKRFDFTDEVMPSRTIKNYSATTPLKEYIYEDHPPRVKHSEVGFIAQQLRQHIPEAVQDPPPAGEYYFADLRPLIAHLIGAVQQLTKRLAAVEDK